MATEPWTPSPYTVFKIVMSARLCAAAWNIVGDCDETYNYWEPVWQEILNDYDSLSRGRTYVMITHVSKENNLGPGDKIRYIWGLKGPIFIL